MITPNSKFIILKSPIELDNLNQLTFANATSQYNYFYNLSKREYDEVTFIRKDNIVVVETNEDFTYDDLLLYNYCMYQNTSYGDKWFYAFIEDCNYLSDGSCELKIKTDVFQTWQFDITWKQSFIEREHIAKSSDVIGANLVPENVETGEFISNEENGASLAGDSGYCFIFASTSEPIAGEAKDTMCGSRIYNGLYTGCCYYRYDSTSALDVTLEIFANSGKLDSIVGIFIAPKVLAPLDTGGGTAQLYREVEQSNSPYTKVVQVSRISTLDGYTPRNKKLLSSPFSYLLVVNNVGQQLIYEWEKFVTDNDTCAFNINGVLNPGCSVNVVPYNYNSTNLSHTRDETKTMTIGKFPICSFQNDMYTNWLTQNSINILGQTITTDDLNMGGAIISSAIGTLTAGATGNMAGVGLSLANGFQGVTNALIQKKQHNMISPSVSGQLNSGDVVFATGKNDVYFYKMSIRQQFARKIDSYFDMYGYATNQLKLPNLNNRSNWNFVKTINANIIGDVPQKDIEEIKSMFNNGITLWHTTTHFLDYSQSNN